MVSALACRVYGIVMSLKIHNCSGISVSAGAGFQSHVKGYAEASDDIMMYLVSC